ncbi:MAG: hypothetical protein JJU02_00915 [Cryomorphaceae bacterium]|nr:hypothetical protein [Cryomorphaceae bacterium]
MSDVLQKTGIVERSGQGVDKIFYQTLKEGKPQPDYSKSDDFSVVLNLSAIVEDKAFAIFIESVQSDLGDDEKLSVHEIIHLNQFRKGSKNFNIDKIITKRMLDRGLIDRRGKTSGVYYVLSKKYYEYADEKGVYSKVNLDEKQAFILILGHLKNFEKAKMKDFVDLFHGRLTRKQVRNIVDKLVESKELKKNGSGSGTYYTVGENYVKGIAIINKAIKIGMDRLKADGEI